MTVPENIYGALLGASGVGKTSILARMDNQGFQDQTSTASASTYIFDFQIDFKSYQLHITDTAGQEEYESITSSYLRGKQLFLFVTSVDELLSGKKIRIPRFMQMAIDANDSFVPIFVINKIDKSPERAEELQQKLHKILLESTLEQWIPQKSEDIWVISCKTRENFDDCINYVQQKSAEFILSHPPDPLPPPVSIQEKTIITKDCNC